MFFDLISDKCAPFWHTKSMIRALLAILIAVTPLAAQDAPEVKSMITPTSDAHVRLLAARITELNCSRRSSKFEATKHSANHFPYMKRNTFNRGVDPRSMLVGIFSIVMLVPVTIVSVPVDVFSMPFRKECDFELTIDGKLQAWAGRPTPNMPVALEGANLLKKGIEGVSVPKFFRTRGTATSNKESLFSITLKGHVGSSKELMLRFFIDGRKANSLVLRKSGKIFLLAEEDPGFGTGVHTNETLEIVPELAKN